MENFSVGGAHVSNGRKVQVHQTKKAKSFVVHTERTAGSSIQMNARVYNDCTWGKGRGGKKKKRKNKCAV